MHVVHLVSAAQLGGAETSVLEMAAGVRNVHPDMQVSVVAPAEGPFVTRLRQQGVEAAVLTFPSELESLGEAGRLGTRGGRIRLGGALLIAGPRALGYGRRLRRLLESSPFAPARIVHAHGFKMHVLGALGRPAGARLIWHMHDYPGGRAFSARILRRLLWRCSVIVANSQSVAADVRRTFGGDVPLRVIYNAVDLDRFSPHGDVLDLDGPSRLPPPPDGTVRIGLVATFGRWKGHETFLRALSLMPDRTRIRAYLIGGPVYRTAESQHSESSLRHLAEQLGIAESLAFAGHLEDVASAMRRLDVVVHASTAPEPFGMVIAEGMASGRAVVASLSGGSAELVQDGVDAIGHPPGDAAALAAALTRLVEDPALRHRIAAAGRVTAERRFDRRRLAAELTTLYKGLAA